MKTKLISFLLVCGLVTSLCVSSAFGKATNPPDKEEIRDAISTLRNFYVPYIYNRIGPYWDTIRLDANDLLVPRYMTKSLIAKIGRIRSATDYNPIVRAQDSNDESFRTLQFEHRSDRWYVVSYKWYSTDSVRKEIPFEVKKIKGQYMIVDIEKAPYFHLKK